jgi:uncharacterized protein YkwD
MVQAAEDHANDLSKRLEVTHEGTDASTPMDRLKRYGIASGRHAQSIALGKDTATGIVIQMLVCDGVKSLVDRTHLFSEAFQYLGVSCGPHMVHQYVCVLKYCADYTNRSKDERKKAKASLVGM